MRARVALAAALLTISAGVSAESLDLESLKGEPARLELDPTERALVVHFWATWCPECVEELPVLARAASRCAERGVRIVTVNVAEDRKTVERFVARHRLDLPVYRDPRGRAWRRLGGVGLPTNLLWSQTERRIDIGPRDAAAWARTLLALGCGAAPASGGLP